MRITVVVIGPESPDLPANARRSLDNQTRPPDEVLAMRRDEPVDVAQRGDVVCFVEHDDRWPPDFLARVERALADEPRACAAAGDYRIDGTWFDARSFEGDAIERIIRTDAPPAGCSAFSVRALRSLADRDAAAPTSLGTALRLSTLGRWVHLPGEPVSIARPANRPPHDRALTVSRFLFDQGGWNLLLDRAWRRPLARIWAEAGRAHLRRGEFPEASSCFASAAMLWTRAAYRLARFYAALRCRGAGQRPLAPEVPDAARPTRWYRRLPGRLSRSVRRRWYERVMRRPRPFGNAELPPATVVLLSFKRPQNLDRIVRTCLAARFVERVVVSNNNPEIAIDEWLHARDERLEVIEQPRPMPPSLRFQLSMESGGEHFIAIDDDVFLLPSQLSRLYQAYLSEPEVPHGYQGQRLVEGAGREYLVSGYLGEGRVDVLNCVYLYSRLHVEEWFRLLDSTGIDSFERLTNGEDIVLSYSGDRRPRIHAVGPVLQCPTVDAPGIALWRKPGFAVERLDLCDRLGLLKARRNGQASRRA